MRIGLTVLLVSATITASAQTPDRTSSAHAQIERLIAASGHEVAVVWRPLDAQPGEEIRINDTTRFHAASTMKVPVMIELFRQRDAGS